MVIEYEKIKNILPEGFIELEKKIKGGEEIEDKYKDIRIRLIPFSSLGKQNGVLLGVKVDKIKINYKDQEEWIENIVIGIYNKKLTKDGKYSALIGLKVLETVNDKSNEHNENAIIKN